MQGRLFAVPRGHRDGGKPQQRSHSADLESGRQWQSAGVMSQLASHLSPEARLRFAPARCYDAMPRCLTCFVWLRTEVLLRLL